MGPIERRRFLQGLLGAAGLGAVGTAPMLVPTARAEDGEPRFVIVFGCFGGASMLDCFAPVDGSEAFTGSRGTVFHHDVVTPEGSNLRCPNRSTPYNFLLEHGSETLVLGYQASSVNHFEAQRRVMNGRGAFEGRTLPEAVAATWGANMPLPNVTMGRAGFAEPGTDAAMDPRYKVEVVTNPVTFALSTSGHAGVIANGERALQDPEKREELVGLARSVRDEHLESLSGFAQTFPSSRLRQTLLSRRMSGEVALEEARLIQELLFVPDLGEIFPLSAYGLSASEEANLVLDYLDDAWPTSTSGIADDPLQAQAALAYLLIRTGTSAAVTLTDPGTDGFLAFDQSHYDHADAQAAHWDRGLDTASRLIQLLKQAEWHDESGKATGTSYWDRTMIVFATEFGRDKFDDGRDATGHQMNNGLLVVSPMVKGNQLLGAVDPNNGYISGYDLDTGEPTPFTDLEPGEDPLYDDERLPAGAETIYGALSKVLGVEFEGREEIPAIEM